MLRQADFAASRTPWHAASCCPRRGPDWGSGQKSKLCRARPPNPHPQTPASSTTLPSLNSPPATPSFQKQPHARFTLEGVLLEHTLQPFPATLAGSETSSPACVCSPGYRHSGYLYTCGSPGFTRPFPSPGCWVLKSRNDWRRFTDESHKNLANLTSQAQSATKCGVKRCHRKDLPQE